MPVRRQLSLMTLAAVVLLASASCAGSVESAIVRDVSSTAGLSEIAHGKDESGSAMSSSYWIFEASQSFAEIKPVIEDSVQDSGWSVRQPANALIASHAVFGLSADESECISVIDVTAASEAVFPYREFIEDRYPDLVNRGGESGSLLLVIVSECV